MRMRIRACARTIIYRRASIRIGIMRSISNPCSMTMTVTEALAGQ